MSKTLPLLRLVCAFAILVEAAYPQGQPMPGGRVRIPARQPQVSQQLKNVLVEWYQQTSQIKTLAGYHSKFTYDMTFNIEKRGAGRFYYEAPDKGRIDIGPGHIDPGEKSRRIDPKTKKPFALQAEQIVQWVSTGKNIYHIEPDKKKATRYPIPPKAQGRNIMDGPLPFLLGMPPNKAVQRYRLQIIKDKAGRPMNNRNEVWLQVWPKWKSDAANYRQAKVILDKTNHFLPKAVQLTDPTGNMETVYTFYKTAVNTKSLLQKMFGRSPFDINLRGFRIANTGTPIAANQKQPAPNKRPARKTRIAAELKTVPNLSGYPFKDARKHLEQLGFKVKFRRGSIAKKKELVYRVESQSPGPYRKARPGDEIVLTLFVTENDLRPRKRTAAKP